jgi:hypothetical protein
LFEAMVREMPLKKFARMLEEHWLGVIRWHHSKVSNALLGASTRSSKQRNAARVGSGPTATSSP